MRRPFTGVGTALVTPFRKDGSLDEAAVKRLARRQIDAGVHFLSPCGTTGEAPTLNHREKLRVVELVLEEAKGKVPVPAGASFDATETTPAPPTAIVATVTGSSPLRTMKSSRVAEMISDIWTRSPGALTAMMFGISASRAVVCTSMLMPVRPGTL